MRSHSALKVLVIHCGTVYLNQLLNYLSNLDVLVFEMNFDTITMELGMRTETDLNSRLVIDASEIKDVNYDAVIYAGGAIRESIVPGIYRKIKSWSMNYIRSLKLPFLGICLGHMMLGFAYGAAYRTLRSRRDSPVEEEKGITKITFHKEYPLAPGRKYLEVFEDHERELCRLPSCLVNTASSMDSPIQAIYHINKRQYGVQFHPEVVNTEGQIVLDTFLKNI